MQEKLKKLLEDAKLAITKADISTAINDLKVKYLGKNGELTGLLKNLKDVPNEEKPIVGKIINDVKTEIENTLKTVEKRIKDKEKDIKYKLETLDVTLSKRNGDTGSLHPISLVINEITDIFVGLGFRIEDGPEIESDYYNFQALNIPADHPSRDMQDTFYLSEKFLLRSQTSAVQVHAMEDNQPPIRIICPGKVYRSDDDATHSPMFHQIEGLVIDKNITLCDLKGILEQFAQAFFNKETRTRLRPSYFPFTEPSVEVDLSCTMCNGVGCRLCKGTGWIELLGAGVVNPAVLEMSGIDSSVYTGFAFGMGVERAAMIKYAIPDMRLLFENDIRYLKQYK